MKTPQEILKNVFGYDTFRPLQAEIIQNVLVKKDTLVIMPTGGGKSICYQIPALIFEGLTIVISPLISLMKDQVEQMKALGVPAIFLNSTLSPQEYFENVELVQANKVKLLYLAPEALMTESVQKILGTQKIDCLTIDEAHCISEWGHDFRPEYRQIVEVKNKFPEAVCIALTATATPRVREDIKKSLNLSSANEFLASFDRKNLNLQVVTKDNPSLQTIKFLEKHKKQSGIIYCFSRKQVDELTAILEANNFSVKPYHAGLSAEERTQNQEDFIRDNVQIIVATIAFGMGIDKPNVRFVLHFDLPKNIEGYYQEIGRGGRDGLKSDCLLLYSYGDIRKLKYFIDQKEPSERQIAEQHLQKMVDFAEAGICRRVPLMEYFGENYEAENCGMCDNCMETDEGLEDLTIAAQKFFSCVKRTGEIFGAKHISQVLRGSSAKNILKFNHQELSTYGIGVEFSEKQWLDFAIQFLKKGLIVKDTNYGSLKLTEKAYLILKGKEKFLGKLLESQKEKQATQEMELDYDTELFEQLRRKRKNLADSENVPPYVIFSDKSLVEMSTYFPQSKESMLEINGVGNAKLEKYGLKFLNEIFAYCQAKGISEKPKSKITYQVSRGSSKVRRHFVVGEKFNSGKSISELKEEFGVQESTIFSHLQKYLFDGNKIRKELGLEVIKLSKAPREKQIKALNLFNELGHEFLRPIFEAMNEEISYEDLRILRLYFLIRTTKF